MLRTAAAILCLATAPARAADKPAEIIGHRGASHDAPENTIAAFDRGLAAGADGLELDVRLSKDGEVVVIHDETLDRTTDARGPVRPAPKLGQHTDEVLAEVLKLSGGEIARLHDARIVAGPEEA